MLTAVLRGNEHIQRSCDLLTNIFLKRIITCICFELFTLTPDWVVLMKLCIKVLVDPIGRCYWVL